jgi:hypothetical protein
MSEVEQEEQNQEEQENEETSIVESEVEDDNQNERVPIDLSENEFYRGICTLFEDDDGNNILEYISLLHTELIGINKSLENLRGIRKDISRIADCAELFFKSQAGEDVKKPDEKRKVKRADK